MKTKEIQIGKVIRELREKQGMVQKELCEKTRIDQRTITAIEMGRIVNPSLKNLKLISNALGITLKDLFAALEADTDSGFFLGSLKGEFVIDYPQHHSRVTSYLPRGNALFAGKISIGGKKTLDNRVIKIPGQIFIQPIIGRLDIKLEDKETTIKEGQIILFDGRLAFTITNPMMRDTTALLFTAPSFV